MSSLFDSKHVFRPASYAKKDETHATISFRSRWVTPEYEDIIDG